MDRQDRGFSPPATARGSNSNWNARSSQHDKIPTPDWNPSANTADKVKAAVDFAAFQKAQEELTKTQTASILQPAQIQPESQGAADSPVIPPQMQLIPTMTQESSIPILPESTLTSPTPQNTLNPLPTEHVIIPAIPTSVNEDTTRQVMASPMNFVPLAKYSPSPSPAPPFTPQTYYKPNTSISSASTFSSSIVFLIVGVSGALLIICIALILYFYFRKKEKLSIKSIEEMKSDHIISQDENIVNYAKSSFPLEFYNEIRETTFNTPTNTESSNTNLSYYSGQSSISRSSSSNSGTYAATEVETVCISINDSFV